MDEERNPEDISGSHGEDAADKPGGGALSADNPTDPSEPTNDERDEESAGEQAGGEPPEPTDDPESAPAEDSEQ